MKLATLFETKTQLVTVTFPGKTLTYTMVLKPFGLEGNGRTIWIGDCEVHDSKDEHHETMKVAAVFREDGSLYAAKYAGKPDIVANASRKAQVEKRRAFGTGHGDPLDNWTVYRKGEVEVEGYTGASE